MLNNNKKIERILRNVLGCMIHIPNSNLVEEEGLEPSINPLWAGYINHYATLPKI